MAKASGKTRKKGSISTDKSIDYGELARERGRALFAKPFPFSEGTLRALYEDRLKAKDVNRKGSYLDVQHNAFFIQIGDRVLDENEKIAVEFMIRKGISIEVTPEGIIAYATSISTKKEPLFSDGRLSNHIFEQKTIDITALNAIRSIKYGIDHAVKKNAEVAVIFDRYGKIKRKEQVGAALKEYKLPKYGKMPEAIVIITEGGEVEEFHP